MILPLFVDVALFGGIVIQQLNSETNLLTTLEMIIFNTHTQ